MTTHQAADLIELLLAAYPGARAKLSSDHVEAMAAAFYAGLSDIDFASARQAVNRVVKSSRFLPSIAEIREAVVDATHGARPDGGTAWASVVRAMREQGAYRVPGKDFVFRDPLVVEALKIFTWKDLCTSEDLVANRAHFIRCYDQLAQRTRKEAQISGGAGARALPSGSDEPRKIGDLLTLVLEEKTS